MEPGAVPVQIASRGIRGTRDWPSAERSRAESTAPGSAGSGAWRAGPVDVFVGNRQYSPGVESAG